MPTIGGFHAKFWKARANVPPPPGTATGWMYPGVQSVVTMHMAVFGVPFDLLRPFWAQLRWSWGLVRRLWHWRAPAQRARLALWIARLETLDEPQQLALERAVAVITSSAWASARLAVQACATTPKFHQPEQWVAYGRAIKANPGQAQNVYRHLKAVQDVRGLSDGEAPLSNPDAHLVVELAYQAFAAIGRPERKVVAH